MNIPITSAAASGSSLAAARHLGKDKDAPKLATVVTSAQHAHRPTSPKQRSPSPTNRPASATHNSHRSADDAGHSHTDGSGGGSSSGMTGPSGTLKAVLAHAEKSLTAMLSPLKLSAGVGIAMPSLSIGGGGSGYGSHSHSQMQSPMLSPTAGSVKSGSRSTRSRRSSMSGGGQCGGVCGWV